MNLAEAIQGLIDKDFTFIRHKVENTVLYLNEDGYIVDNDGEYHTEFHFSDADHWEGMGSQRDVLEAMVERWRDQADRRKSAPGNVLRDCANELSKFLGAYKLEGDEET